MSLINVVLSFFYGIYLSLTIIPKACIYVYLIFPYYYKLIIISVLQISICSLFLITKEYNYRFCIEYQFVAISDYIYCTIFPSLCTSTKDRNYDINNEISDQLMFTKSNEENLIISRIYTILLFIGLGLPILGLCYCFTSIYTIRLFDAQVRNYYCSLYSSSSNGFTDTFITSTSSSSSSLSISNFLLVFYRTIFFTVFNVLIIFLNYVLLWLSNVLLQFLWSNTIHSYYTLLQYFIEYSILLLISYSYSIIIFDHILVIKENYLQDILRFVAVSSSSTNLSSSNNTNISSSSLMLSSSTLLSVPSLQTQLHNYKLSNRLLIYNHYKYIFMGYNYLFSIFIQHIYNYYQNKLDNPVSYPSFISFLSILIHMFCTINICNSIYSLIYPIYGLHIFYTNIDTNIYNNQIPFHNIHQLHRTKISTMFQFIHTSIIVLFEHWIQYKRKR